MAGTATRRRGASLSLQSGRTLAPLGADTDTTLTIGLGAQVNVDPVSYTHLDVYKRQGMRAAAWMEAHLAGRDFLVGEAPTIADIALYPYLSLIHI